MGTKCLGCGSVLQSADENEIGYIPEKLIKKPNAICMRCFRLRNYNSENEIISKDYLKIISSLAKEDGLIVHVVDLFDFSSTFLSSIKRQTGQTDCILVGNKFDLLPKSVKKYKVISWMRHMCNLENFDALDVVVTSGTTGDNIEELMQAIVRLRKNRKLDNIHFFDTPGIFK